MISASSQRLASCYSRARRCYRMMSKQNFIWVICAAARDVSTPHSITWRALASCSHRCRKFMPTSAWSCSNSTAWTTPLAAHQRALAIDPAFETALSNLGRCYVSRGDHGNAICAFKRAVDILPDSGVAAQNLAHAFRQSQQYDDAIRWFETAIDLDPTLVGAHNGLGNCYRETGNYRAALRSYQNALDHGTSNAEILYNLSVLYCDMRNFEDALAVAEHALREPTRRQLGPLGPFQSLGRPKSPRRRPRSMRTRRRTRSRRNSRPVDARGPLRALGENRENDGDLQSYSRHRSQSPRCVQPARQRSAVVG